LIRIEVAALEVAAPIFAYLIGYFGITEIASQLGEHEGMFPFISK
jgi:hypothetical protein